MRKIKFILLAAILVFGTMPSRLVADEGMWMVQMFESIYPQMVKKGLKLKPGEIYNPESGNALGDAIVALDFGCTGSMISKTGLMITNHHCAYGDIHSLSTKEHNYLENGFWAMNRSQEIYIPGKNVFFLRKVIDVTDEVKTCAEQVKKTGFKGMLMRRVYKMVENKHKKDTPYEVMCASMWNGIKYYMYYYEVYSDVRLVGAPPVSIGAFGGETDNWGWPQHKGDFAIYRVYADKNGRPAKYSKDNQPLVPSKVLNISVSGVKEGDYSMIMGYPGRINRYVSSCEVKQKQEILNPIIVEARRGKLDVWEKHMNQDPAIRLLYSDKYFGISNYTDYAKWENKCFKRYNVIGIREAEESGFTGADKTMLEEMKQGFEAKQEAVRARAWFRECFVSPCEWLASVKRLAGMTRHMQKCKIKCVNRDSMLVKKAVAAAAKDFKKFDMATDLDLLKLNIGLFIKNMPPEYYSDTLQSWVKKFNGNADAIAEYIYENSDFSSVEKIKKFFSVPRTIEEIDADPAVKYISASGLEVFNKLDAKVCRKVGFDPDSYKSKYTHALYELRKSRNIPQYPNANSTMRISYGTVGGVEPYDAVKYAFRSSIKGYGEKEDPDAYEFHVNDRMKSLIAAGDWGRWGEKGELYVDFLTNNDITGGNSGSPVLNARGNIIGLAFDGNRECMSGDAYFHPQNSKTVCVDIRFVLWVIDKYAGAGFLIDEMNLVK